MSQSYDDEEPETAVPHPAGSGEQPVRSRGEEAAIIRAAVVEPIQAVAEEASGDLRRH